MKMFIEDDEVETLRKPALSTSAFLEGLGKRKVGKQEGSHNLPELTKELIARDVINRDETGLSEKEIGSIHGVAQQTSSYLGRGFTTSAIDTRKRNEAISALIAEKKVSIAQRIISKTDSMMERFDPDKLDHNEIPGAVVKLATAMEKVASDFTKESHTGPTFIIYTPERRSEDYYDVIDVRAEKE